MTNHRATVVVVAVVVCERAFDILEEDTIASSPVNSEIKLQLFGNEPLVWIRMQGAYDGEWTEHGGHAARFLLATVSRPSRTAALVTATR